jgi:hypothetical protein
MASSPLSMEPQAEMIKSVSDLRSLFGGSKSADAVSVPPDRGKGNKLGKESSKQSSTKKMKAKTSSSQAPWDNQHSSSLISSVKTSQTSTSVNTRTEENKLSNVAPAGSTGKPQPASQSRKGAVEENNNIPAKPFLPSRKVFMQNAQEPTHMPQKLILEEEQRSEGNATHPSRIQTSKKMPSLPSASDAKPVKQKESLSHVQQSGRADNNTLHIIPKKIAGTSNSEPHEEETACSVSELKPYSTTAIQTKVQIPTSASSSPERHQADRNGYSRVIVPDHGSSAFRYSNAVITDSHGYSKSIETDFFPDDVAAGYSLARSTQPGRNLTSDPRADALEDHVYYPLSDSSSRAFVQVDDYSTLGASSQNVNTMQNSAAAPDLQASPASRIKRSPSTRPPQPIPRSQGSEAHEKHDYEELPSSSFGEGLKQLKGM